MNIGTFLQGWLWAASNGQIGRPWPTATPSTASVRVTSSVAVISSPTVVRVITSSSPSISPTTTGLSTPSIFTRSSSFSSSIHVTTSAPSISSLTGVNAGTSTTNPLASTFTSSAFSISSIIGSAVQPDPSSFITISRTVVQSLSTSVFLDTTAEGIILSPGISLASSSFVASESRSSSSPISVQPLVSVVLSTSINSAIPSSLVDIVTDLGDASSLDPLSSISVIPASSLLRTTPSVLTSSVLETSSITPSVPVVSTAITASGISGVVSSFLVSNPGDLVNLTSSATLSSAVMSDSSLLLSTSSPTSVASAIDMGTTVSTMGSLTNLSFSLFSSTPSGSLPSSTLSASASLGTSFSGAISSTSLASSVTSVIVTPTVAASSIATAGPTSSSTSTIASASAAVPVSANANVLLIVRNITTAVSVYSGLQGYGIPYELLVVPSTGASLPELNSSATVGNYGGIVVLGEVSYDYGNNTYRSALTGAQWQQLYDYQTAFGVRMVRLDVFPGPRFGTTVARTSGGCCNGTEQLVSFTNTSGFSTAGLKLGATMSTKGLWHYPAIVDDNNTWEVAKFAPGDAYTTDTTAAVINQFENGNGVRQQMAWFTSFATDWSTTSNFLMHSWIHWMTRGLYVGHRRLYLSTQIDDLFLDTELYIPNGSLFRLRKEDLAAHVTWTKQIIAKMPAGSDFFVELAHNGDGNTDYAIRQDNRNPAQICNPNQPIWYDQNDTAPIEFQKPLGTGTDFWPPTPTSYLWKLDCLKLDSLLPWLLEPVNRDAFGHVSHTFTHLALNNVTYSDTSKEISFNRAWMALTSIDQGKHYSANGLVPPRITGLHNGDAIKAFLDNNIKYVVGDNTRPQLVNQENSFWPLTSTVERNGYAGLEIVPRWATTIYFNCDFPNCTLEEWVKTSAGTGDFDNLLRDAKTTNTRHLLGLHHDPFMFHQANMRWIDMPLTTINGVSAQLSLLAIWVEVVVQEMVRLVNWPILTLKHDDLALSFIARRTRDQCKPNMSWIYSADGKSINGVTVGANGNTCSTAIPVTFPVPVTSLNGGTAEQLGSDPLTVWVNLRGSPVTFALTTPIAL